MQNLKSVFVFGLVTVLSSVGLGANLFTPFALDSAQVLPKGVRNVRVIGFTTQISGKFDGQGTDAPIGQSFNKTVKVGELLEAQPSGFERARLEGGLKSFGIDRADDAGQAYGVVHSRITSTVPMGAWGVTEKLTVAVAVPVLYSNVSVRTGWVMSPSLKARVEKDLADAGQSNKLIAVRDQLSHVINAKISQNGYKPLEDAQRTELGDITLGAKYQFAKGLKYAAAVVPRLILPTGRTSDVDRVIDIAPGWGSYTAGLGVVYDYSLSSAVTLTPSVSYLYPFANSRASRIPLNYEESLTPDVDRNVSFKAGDIFSAGVAARFLADELYTIGVGYSFQSKRRDSYSGSAYEAQRYQYLSKDTEQRMHAAQVSATYSTIPLFKKKQFPIPLETTLGLSTVLGGVNVNRAALMTADIAAFF